MQRYKGRGKALEPPLSIAESDTVGNIEFSIRKKQHFIKTPSIKPSGTGGTCVDLELQRARVGGARSAAEAAGDRGKAPEAPLNTTEAI